MKDPVPAALLLPSDGRPPRRQTPTRPDPPTYRWLSVSCWWHASSWRARGTGCGVRFFGARHLLPAVPWALRLFIAHTVGASQAQLVQVP